MTGHPFLSDEQSQLIDMVARFCADKIAPVIEKDDQEKTFRRELFDEMAALGLVGITLPEAHGGAELPSKDFALVIEEISKVAAPYAVVLAVSCLPASILAADGTDAQKKRWVEPLAEGRLLGAFALTEPGSGSDAASLKTTAKRDGDHYVLNGQKMFITSAGHADVYVVFARTGGEGARGISAFIVKKDTDGFTVGAQEKKMGWNTSPLAPLFFENCRVPADHLIGSEGNGFKYALRALDAGRINVGAMAVGIAQAAVDASVDYARERKQFGKPIGANQGLQWMLADMAMATESARRMVYHAVALRDAGQPFTQAAAMAKCIATDAAMKVTTDAVQVFGGSGYLKDYPVERWMRDAKVCQIVEGTNQIQRIVVARDLIGRF